MSCTLPHGEDAADVFMKTDILYTDVVIDIPGTVDISTEVVISENKTKQVLFLILKQLSCICSKMK